MTSTNINDLRPMLAATLKSADELVFPHFASFKLDGIRCRVLNGQGISRSGKLLPNRHVQGWIRDHAGFLQHLDGELIVGLPHGRDVYNRTMSGIMSEGGQPVFTYWVFDHTGNPKQPFFNRLKDMRASVERYAEHYKGFEAAFNLRILPQNRIGDHGELEALEADASARGYEGLILRNQNSPYKNGRATIKQFGMVKVKRFTDAEAYIVGFEELLHNANEEVVSELGYATHSSHKENMIPQETLGALVCRTIHTLEGGTPTNPTPIPAHTQFNIGTGFDAATRQKIWDDRSNLEGACVKFKYFPYGSLNAPRQPVFLGFRDEMDT